MICQIKGGRMEKSKDVVELTMKEMEIIKNYQETMKKIKNALGSLRYKYMASEQKAIEGVAKAESDYLSYINELSKSKDLAIDSEQWVFDPEKLLFRKITQ
jgi:hypothetical protein